MFIRFALASAVFAIAILALSAESAEIKLNYAQFDPCLRLPNIPTGLTRKPEAGRPDYFIVQLTGPVTQAMTDALRKVGAELLDYIPDYALLVRATPEAIDNDVRKLDFVRWVGLYHPAFAVSPLLRGVSGNLRINILLFPGEQVESIREDIQAAGATIRSVASGSHGAKLDVTISANAINSIATRRGVAWIEPYVEPKLTNDVARGLMNISQAWSGVGLYGSGEVVAVCDTGLDTGNTSTLSADFSGRLLKTYALGRNKKWDDPNGHGTHVAGSVLGSGVLSGSNPAAHNYAGSFAGVAPEAQLVFQSVLDNTGGLGGLPADLNNLFQPPYNDGARIHTNSWGAEVNGAYTIDSRNVDVFTWNHPDMTILFAAGNAGTDANADGVVDLDSIDAPGTAKNCITVGASESYRLSGGAQGTYGSYWPSDFPANPISGDKVSNNSSGIAAFSSRGPTDDGRIKPDLVAPGTNVISCRSHASGAGVLWGVYDSNYVYSGGTSMSVPLTAGAATLVRSYYRTIRGHNPSAALIKATLINGAADLYPGQYGTGSKQEIPSPRPNNVEGWGLVNPAYLLTPGANRAFEFVDATTGIGTGQSATYTYYVRGSNSPFRVTLVWTDYPAAVYASPALVNDLDLVVISPSGSQLRGNGTVDRLNNVEGVDVLAPLPGYYAVQVNGFNVPFGPQRYALVVSGEIGLPAPTAEISSPPNGIFLDGPVTIVGTAAGEGFQQYVLEYGVGNPPSSWTIVVPPQTSPVTQGVLGVWNTQELDSGDYTLRLTVTGTGGTSQSQVAVTLLRSAISDVKNLPDGTSVTVTGKVVSAGPTELGSLLYVQEPNRTSGIRVNIGTGSTNATIGDLVTVIGTLVTFDGERVIVDPTIIVTGTAP